MASYLIVDPNLAVQAAVKCPIVMAFQNFQDRDDDSRFDKVTLRRSTNQGEYWDEPTPVNLIEFPPEAARPFDPAVVWDPAGSQAHVLLHEHEWQHGVGRKCLYPLRCVRQWCGFMYEADTRFCAPGGAVIDPAVGLLDLTWYYSAPRILRPTSAIINT